MAALILVSTPIGNLGDLSPRAVETLRSAAIVCCEDTRRTGRLLQHAGVTARRLMVINDHTEAAKSPEVIATLAAGGDVALVTDAGTPGISDPGERLVRAVLDAGHDVSAVPGPAAIVTALVISGLPTSRFTYEGFLPRSGSERRQRVADIAAERRTVVLYEAPHRIARTIGDLAAACGPDRAVALARELTKLHEEVWRGTLGEAVAHAATVEPRGEYVVVVGPAPAAGPTGEDEIREAVADAMRSGLSRKDAVAQVAARLSAPRRQVYEVALRADAGGSACSDGDR